MTKQTGLGDNFYWSGVDLSGDVNSISKLSTPVAPIDATDITQFANARLFGLRSAEVDWVSYFDPTGAHPTLSALPLTDQIAMYCRGTAIGSPAFACQGLQLNYDPTRGADGSLTCAITEMSDKFGGEWGELLTPGKRTDSVATNGPSQDDNAFIANGATTPFGGQAYLQVFAVAGGTPDVTIQHAPDNNAWTTLIDFGNQNAVGAFRATTAVTVQRYLRVVTTGAMSNLVFAVMFCRNVVATVF